MSEKTGVTLGWIGLIVGVIGFFVWQFWLGAIAIIFGLAGLFAPKKALPWLAVAAGVISVIIGFYI